MTELIEKLPIWVIISILILVVFVVIFVVTMLAIAFFTNRELKLGPISIGTAKNNEPLISTQSDNIEIVGDQIESYQKKIKFLTQEIDELKTTDTSNSPQVGSMITIPTGAFLMGSNVKEHSKPEHEIYLDAFMIDVYPTTNGEFKQFIDDYPQWNKENSLEIHRNLYYLFYWNGNNFPEGKRYHPVVHVNWLAAVGYCNWRSIKDGLTPCYDEKGLFHCDFEANGYRLPTEAEFEKTAKGGNMFIYIWGETIDESQANYNHNVNDTTFVGKYAANNYGVYDICGNVKEWCWDWFNENYYTADELENPKGPKSGKEKVFRGGSWASGEKELQCAHRGWLFPQNTNPDFGFRTVKKP